MYTARVSSTTSMDLDPGVSESVPGSRGRRPEHGEESRDEHPGKPLPEEERRSLDAYGFSLSTEQLDAAYDTIFQSPSETLTVEFQGGACQQA
jgi:hypothetical protein